MVEEEGEGEERTSLTRCRISLDLVVFDRMKVLH